MPVTLRWHPHIYHKAFRTPESRSLARMILYSSQTGGFTTAHGNSLSTANRENLNGEGKILNSARE